MRRLCGWISVLMLTTACGADGLPIAPSSSSTSSPLLVGHPVAGTHAPEPIDGWLPWSFRQWQPGLGEPLGVNAAIESKVEANDVCVSNLRQVWDARSSCKRFLVSAPSSGWLYSTLRWDDSAPGFDLALAGDVVFVRPDGRFASSDWQRTEVEVAARVEPGDYTVLVITYGPVSLPFQLRTALR
jgi:hypothetical protein